MKKTKKIANSQLHLPLPNDAQNRALKYKRPNPSKVRQYMLFASGFVTLCFKMVRLVEELVKVFKP
jgi:hypothetical protein